MYYGRIESRFGQLVTKINKEGFILGLWFDKQKYFPQIDKHAFWINNGKSINLRDIETDEIADNRIVEQSDTQIEREVLKTFKKLCMQLKEFDNANLKSFDLKLQAEGTTFQKKVWELLLKIPYGQTTSYGNLSNELALVLNKEKMSAQAVGGAVGHNPISIIIPCHRVLGAKGQLTGYAAGLDIKLALLKHEEKLI